jgi:hypothetical protein
MRKPNLRGIVCLLTIILCVTAFSGTALANSDNHHEEIPVEPPATTERPAGGLYTPFTPDGNLSLIDDFGYIGTDEDGNIVGKQFITVQSKTGNYFYIVIDRAGDTENVFFLNMVDEADLMTLIDAPEETGEPTKKVCTCIDKCYAGHVDTSCPVCGTNMSECTGKEVQKEQTSAQDEQETETPKKKSGGNPVLVIVLLLAIGGGVAYYFLKVKGKAKPKTKGNADLDDYDYGAEDAEYEFEQDDSDSQDDGEPEDAEDGGE